MTVQEMEKRIEEINRRGEETLTPEEAESLAAAEAMNDGTTITLEEFQKSIGDYKYIPAQ